MTENKGIYQKLKDARLIGFMKTECHIYGCNDLETNCKDCGKVVNTAHYDSEWISVDVKERDLDVIHLLVDGDSIFISGTQLQPFIFQLCGEIKALVDCRFTHWMPLPKPPKD